MSIIQYKSDYTTRNRAFNCRMRNRYYEEVYYAFRALEPILSELETTDKKEIWHSQMSLQIQKYETIIVTCLEYAQASIFYGKTEKMSSFSTDKRWGILQEEIFIVYFLQELLSTIRYIGTRLDTDHVLQELDISMQLKIIHPQITGFISNLQKNLDALNKATVKEFLDLASHLKERFQIGNAVFGTLQELQHFY
ncbi:MAG TPA: hypothetical protein PK616_08555 [Fibrobacteraceae bacterium]|nr:hypothetical protein [Fibrobacteraceae bacterium]